MAINFPNLPSIGDQFIEPTTQNTYVWDGYKWTTIGLGLNYVSKVGDSISGPLLISNGSTIAPSIGFTASTNSGFYSIGSGGIGIAILGQNTFTLNPDRKIGINVLSPLSDLDVRNPSSTASIRIQSNSGNRFRLIADNSGTNDIYSESSTGTAAASRFFIGTTETININTSSQVGIGGSPSFKLDVISSSGTNTVRSYSSGATDARFVAKNNTNETIFGSDSTGSYISQVSNLPVRIITNNTESIRILGDNSVGIKSDGTTDARFHVSGTKNSNIVHFEAGSNNYDGLFLQTETLSGQAGGVKWIPNNTPSVGTTQFTTHFSNNTSGGTVQHNVAVGGNITVRPTTTQDAVIISGRAGGTGTYGVTITPTTLSASRTLTLPDTTGTVVTTGDSGTVTSTMIANDTIVNEDINSAAAIAGSKISPDFGSQTVTTSGIFSVAAGTAAAPSIAITGDTNTGIYSPGNDQISLATGGVERFRIDSTGQIEAAGLGSASAPAYSFIGGPNTGIYSPGAGQIALATGGTGWVFVDASGNVGIGSSSPGYRLDITSNDTTNGLGYALRLRTNSTAGAAAIQFTDNLATVQYGAISCDTSNNLKFLVTSTERLRIDSSGRLLTGTSNARTVNSQTAQYQLEGTSVATSSASFVQNSNDTNGPRLTFGKTRGTAVGEATVVTSGDNLGSLIFAGANGTDLSNAGSSIVAQVDGTPGVNDMPGRLVFSTTLDGSSTPTERLRITNDGVSCYNQSAPVAVDTTATLTISNLKSRIITSTTAAAVTMTLPTGTDTESGFAGIYTNMSFEWYVINTGATNAVTVADNTGHTIVGSGTVAASTSGHFMSRRTASNTFVTYRLS